MKVTLEELAQPYLIRIIEEDKEAIASNVAELWNAQKDSIVLDGFRKGKVPQDVAEKQYGFENLYRKYVDKLITDAINDVNQQNDVTVMDLQQVIPEQLNKDGIVMQAVAYLKPSIEKLDYSNLKVTKQDDQASEQEVDGQLQAMREQQAIVSPVEDRAAAFEDIVVVSYTGYQKSDDGSFVPFKGGAASNQQLTLLKTSFIPGFGEEIVGMMPGESKSFEVTFPAEYHAKQLAGAETKFDLTLHEVKQKHLPDLDDEFAKTAGKETFEELKQSVADQISERKKQFNQSKAETEICLELVRRAQVSPIPQTMIQKRVGTILEQQAAGVGLSSEDYLKQRKIERATFEQSNYHVAIRDLKVQLILDYVATQENLDPTAEEREEYIASEAERLGYTKEEVGKLATTDQIDAQVRLRKAYDYLLANATYVEQAEGTNG